MTKKELEELYLNKKIHVIINDLYNYVDAWGVVTRVDDACQLHGTWGCLAAIPDIDYISLVD